LSFIREADAVVFIVSPNSISSPICAWEVEQVASLNKRLAPIVLQRVADDRVPKGISRINYLYFDQPHDFESQADKLASALQTDLAWVKEHTRLGEIARRWDERGRSPTLLLRGQDIEDAERWIAWRPHEAPQPTEAHKRLIEYSRRAAVRRQRYATFGSLAAAVVACGLAALAYWQRDQAVEQRKQAQIVESMIRAEQASRALDSGDAGTAVLLALEGLPDAGSADVLQKSRPHVVKAEDVLKEALKALRETAVLGHGSMVFSAVFSPDGGRILTASNDGTARVWSADGKLLAALSHDNAVRSALFSPDGGRIVTASVDHTARVWSADGKPLATLSSDRGFETASFSPDGGRILTVSFLDSEVRLWSVAGKLLVSLSHSKHITSALFSPDGSRILTAADDHTARIWTADGKLLFTLTHKEEAVKSAIFSPDGKHILTATGGYAGENTGYLEGRVYLWDSDGKLILKLPLIDGGVEMAVFSPDGRQILIASTSTAELWDAKAGTRKSVQTIHDGQVRLAKFTPAGHQIVTASGSTGMADNRDFSVRLTDITFIDKRDRLNGHSADLNSLEFSPDGSRMLTASSDSTARIWTISENEPANSTTEVLGDILISIGKKAVPRCLTNEQRARFFLSPEPPSWCIEMAKWPYHTLEWGHWLTEKRAGKSPPFPQ